MNKLLKTITSALLIGVLALSTASCAENADLFKKNTAPDYAATLETFDTYQSGYADFINAGEGNIFYKQSEGFTPAGNYCESTYIESEDGTYMNCTLEVQRNDRVEHDEYYRVDENTMYFVRSFSAEGSTLFTIEKYVVISGKLYFINPETETVDPVAKPDSLDMFLSFSELKTLFGNLDE